MSLLVATDTGTRARKGRGGARLFQCTALAVLTLAAIPAKALGEAPRAAAMRRVVLARVPADHPATIYGTVDKPLVLEFDASLGKGAIRVPGVAVRRSPPNRLVLTPSRVSARGGVAVTVPLQTGAATFALVVKPEASERRVRIVLPDELGSALARKERRPLIQALAAQPLKLERSNAVIPDAVVECRMSFLVRTPAAPDGAAVEIRSADRSLCESSSTLTTRADGAR